MTDKELIKLKNKLKYITDNELKEFALLLYRTFNFINTLENMDIEHVNMLQAEPMDTNIVMTSNILYNECLRLINLDIE